MPSRTRRIWKWAVIAAGLVLGLCAGCEGGLLGPRGHYIKPTIAVMKFENRATCPLKWNLSSGMKDILVDRLVATGRFQVIERPELDSVVQELKFQHSGATRDQNRAVLGRLKNVKYLVKGTITDFGHVSASGGFLNLFNWDILGRNSRAIMGMTLYVVNVESGEIICSEQLSNSIQTQDLKLQAVYKDVAFGGSTFYRTPLGRATAGVIDEAVKRIAGTIAVRPWQAKIALVQPDGTVVINGGQNVAVAVGQEYEVLQAGQPIFDPDTGDVIGRQPGVSLGRIRVTKIYKRYSTAEVLSGDPRTFDVGQQCHQVDRQVARATIFD